MKMTQKMMLVLSIFCSATLPYSAVLTPENTVAAFDIDGVILNLPKSQYPVIAWKSIKLIESVRDVADLAKTLWYMSKSFSKNATGIYKFVDAEGNAIDGLTPRMLTLGMRHKESTRFIARLLNIIEESRCVDKDVLNILQNTQLPIVLTTNKDVLTYKRIVERKLLEDIALTIIVTKEPLSKEVIEFAQRADTPADYRALIEQYSNDQPTDKIIHAKNRKPYAQYYQTLAAVVGKKNIIFVDDKTKNINGFNDAFANSDALQHVGIPFKNKKQLAHDLTMAMQ